MLFAAVAADYAFIIFMPQRHFIDVAESHIRKIIFLFHLIAVDISLSSLHTGFLDISSIRDAAATTAEPWHLRACFLQADCRRRRR